MCAWTLLLLVAHIVAHAPHVTSLPPPPADLGLGGTPDIVDLTAKADSFDQMLLSTDESGPSRLARPDDLVLAGGDMLLTVEQYVRLYGSLPNVRRPKRSDIVDLSTKGDTFDQMLVSEHTDDGLKNADGHNGAILVDGDMLLNKEQYDSFYKASNSNGNDFKKRVADADTTRYWTNAEITYGIWTDDFSSLDRYLIRRAMTEWERYTCIRFKFWNESAHYRISIQDGAGCNSQVGMMYQDQRVNLQKDICRYKGTYLHELGHAIGLRHEHNRPDRDNYISIIWENIKRHNTSFQKYNWTQVNSFGVPYDYKSIMHYSIKAFSKGGALRTIQPKDPTKDKEIGKVPIKELAYSDVKIVNLMYKCAATCPNQNKCGPKGFLDQNCNCICEDGSSDCERNSPTKVDKHCVNAYENSWKCHIWANQGECERNPKWMGQACAKACGLCGKRPAATRTCKNVYTDAKCKMWKYRGDCVTNREWMRRNCPVTCDLCHDDEQSPEAKCDNNYKTSTLCDDWAKDGECFMKPQLMYQNCRKSCLMCHLRPSDINNKEADANATLAKPIPAPCEDTNPRCGEFNALGDCPKYPDAMARECRKSCDLCEDGSCKNMYGDLHCVLRANNGDCVINSVWMARWCAMTCGRGVCENVKPTPAPTTPPPDPVCEDQYGDRCESYVSEGRCKSSPDRMKTMCAKSCGFCTECKNIKDERSCTLYAYQGKCETNEGVMRRSCAKKCGFCTPGGTPAPPKCKNNIADAFCDAWSKAGKCQTNTEVMKLDCYRSCGYCTPGPGDTTEKPECIDLREDCDRWAGAGRCNENIDLSKNFCRKSCNMCA